MGNVNSSVSQMLLSVPVGHGHQEDAQVFLFMLNYLLSDPTYGPLIASQTDGSFTFPDPARLPRSRCCLHLSPHAMTIPDAMPYNQQELDVLTHPMRYRRIKTLGSGRFAKAVLCKDVLTDTHVVLKFYEKSRPQRRMLHQFPNFEHVSQEPQETPASLSTSTSKPLESPCMFCAPMQAVLGLLPPPLATVIYHHLRGRDTPFARASSDTNQHVFQELCVAQRLADADNVLQQAYTAAIRNRLQHSFTSSCCLSSTQSHKHDNHSPEQDVEVRPARTTPPHTEAPGSAVAAALTILFARAALTRLWAPDEIMETPDFVITRNEYAGISSAEWVSRQEYFQIPTEVTENLQKIVRSRSESRAASAAIERTVHCLMTESLSHTTSNETSFPLRINLPTVDTTSSSIASSHASASIEASFVRHAFSSPSRKLDIESPMPHINAHAQGHPSFSVDATPESLDHSSRLGLDAAGVTPLEAARFRVRSLYSNAHLLTDHSEAVVSNHESRYDSSGDDVDYDAENYDDFSDDDDSDVDLGTVDNKRTIRRKTTSPPPKDKPRGKISESALQVLLHDAVAALCAMQMCGVAHRDVKPANVCISDTGMQLIDWSEAATAPNNYSSSCTLPPYSSSSNSAAIDASTLGACASVEDDNDNAAVLLPRRGASRWTPAHLLMRDSAGTAAFATPEVCDEQFNDWRGSPVSHPAAASGALSESSRHDEDGEMWRDGAAVDGVAGFNDDKSFFDCYADNVYALGATLYCLATGYLPFHAYIRPEEQPRWVSHSYYARAYHRLREQAQCVDHSIHGVQSPYGSRLHYDETPLEELPKAEPCPAHSPMAAPVAYDSAVFGLIAERELCWPADCALSLEARDVMAKMMAKRVSARALWTDILRHPFLWANVEH